jgi:hypothetical protein
MASSRAANASGWWRGAKNRQRGYSRQEGAVMRAVMKKTMRAVMKKTNGDGGPWFYSFAIKNGFDGEKNGN